VDSVQDAVNTAKEHLMKTKLPDMTKIQVPILHSSTSMPKAVLVHICKALSACKSKGYFLQYQEAIDVTLKNSKAIAVLKNMVEVEQAAAAATPPPAEPPVKSQNPKKKKKKDSQEATETTVMEDAKGPLDVAAVKTGTAGTEEAEPPQPSPVELGIKSVHLAERAAERKKVVAAGHFFALYACKSPQQRCTVPMGQNCFFAS
jgi:hypothetical protein